MQYSLVLRTFRDHGSFVEFHLSQKAATAIVCEHLVTRYQAIDGPPTHSVIFVNCSLPVHHAPYTMHLGDKRGVFH